MTNMNPFERSERLMAGVMMASAWMMGISVAVGFVAFFTRLDRLFMFCVSLFGLAGIVILAVIIIGLLKTSMPNTGFERTELHCRVMARYGVNHLNEAVMSELIDGSEDSIRLYVRIWSPTRGATEFECAFPVWCQCGEGMPGKIVYRGGWLCAFMPQLVASGQSPQP